jgi:hypothetical protein
MTITTSKQYPDMFYILELHWATDLNCSEFSLIHIKIEVVKLPEYIAKAQEYWTYFEF